MNLFKKWKVRKQYAISGEPFTRYGLEFLDIRSAPETPHQVVLWVPDGKKHYYWNYGWGCDVAIKEMAAERVYDLYFRDCLSGQQPAPTGEFGRFFKLITSPDHD